MPDQEVAEALRVLRRHGFDYVKLARCISYVSDRHLFLNTVEHICKFCNGDFKRISFRKALNSWEHEKNQIAFSAGILEKKVGPRPRFEDYFAHNEDCIFNQALDVIKLI